MINDGLEGFFLMVLTYFDADLVDGRCRRFLGIDVNEAGILGDRLAKFPHFFIRVAEHIMV